MKKLFEKTIDKLDKILQISEFIPKSTDQFWTGLSEEWFHDFHVFLKKLNKHEYIEDGLVDKLFEKIKN